LADRDIVALQGRIDLVASRCRACQRRDANAAMAMILVVIMLPLLSDQPVRPHAGGAGPLYAVSRVALWWLTMPGRIRKAPVPLRFRWARGRIRYLTSAVIKPQPVRATAMVE
jgi:hypothetical protein